MIHQRLARHRLRHRPGRRREDLVDTLGFDEKDDITTGRLPLGHRGPPELAPAAAHPHGAGPPLDDEAAASIRHLLGKGSLSAVGLAVDDCRKTYDDLVAKGVTFLQEPADRPYGVQAVMRDNSGNWIVLVEPKPYSEGDFGP